MPVFRFVLRFDVNFFPYIHPLVSLMNVGLVTVSVSEIVVWFF